MPLVLARYMYRSYIQYKGIKAKVRENVEGQITSLKHNLDLKYSLHGTHYAAASTWNYAQV